MKTLICLINSFNERDNTVFKYRTDYRVFRLAYQELYKEIRRTATFLKEKGIASGDRVAIWAPNSPEWVIVYFAVVYLDAVIVPIDLKSNLDHAKKILESSGAKLVVKTRFKQSSGTDEIIIEDVEYLSRDKIELNRSGKVDENEMVELVYTSGTTGDPKGVIITHRNLMSNVEAVIRRIKVDENDKMLSVLPLSHLFEQTGGMLAPLSVGASVVYISTLKPSAIFKALKEENITIFILVPRILQGIKRKIRSRMETAPAKYIFKILRWLGKDMDDNKKKKLWFFVHRLFGKHLRFFVSGGSSLDKDTEDFWEELGFRIVQGYGLTECSPILTTNKIDERVRGSIGKPIDNVELKLSEDNEILARGPNIFSGYYRNTEKTKETFSNDWFLTGDIGEKDKEGNYFIKGRKKDMIVTGAGVNIFPDDLEAVLNEIKGVKESAVIGVDNGSGEEIHAVLVLSNNIKAGEIIKKANQKLNNDQEINSFTVWPEPELPKTSTLKVKKNILRSKIKHTDLEEPIQRFVGNIERIIREVIGDAKTITPKSILYSDLALDSIGRVELVSAIEREYDIDFEEELIDQNTSVEILEAMINERSKKKVGFLNLDWNYTKPVKNIRNFLQIILGFPLLRIWCKINSSGQDNLDGIRGPVIFAPNHVSYFDQGAVLLSLPKKYRENVATAAWDEYFRPSKKNVLMYIWKRIFFNFLALVYGIFPLSQQVNFKKNLQFMGKLVDKNENIILFPEGERTRTSEMLPIKKGIGALVNNIRVPVVPVKIGGIEKVLHRDQIFPRRGKITVRFGKPIYFTIETNQVIRERIKTEIERL